jgi:hypothetical protein
MPPIWALLNSNLAIVGIGALLLQIIRNQYQSEAKKNALRMEWLKKTNEEQTQLLNELSHLIASVNTSSLVLSQAIVEDALDFLPETSTDLDDEKHDELEAHQKTLANQIRNWVNPILSNIQQRLTLPKFEYHEENDVLKAHQEAFNNSIRNWMNPILSNYYQIQRLTKPKSDKVAKWFKTSNIKEELQVIQDGNIKKMTMAALVQMLQNKTLRLVELFEDLEEQKKNPAKGNKKTEPNSHIPTFSANEKQQLLYGDFKPLEKAGVKKDELCNKEIDGEFKALLSILCAYQEILQLLGTVDKQADSFFKKLHQGFQAHLKTVDDYI